MPGAVIAAAAQPTRNWKLLMPLLTTALSHLLIILAIGIVTGLVFSRFGRSWLTRHGVSTVSAGDVTFALVGIAGAFIGFHLGVVFELLPSPLALYFMAIVGAIVTLWIWRGR